MATFALPDNWLLIGNFMLVLIIIDLLKAPSSIFLAQESNLSWTFNIIFFLLSFLVQL